MFQQQNLPVHVMAQDDVNYKGTAERLAMARGSLGHSVSTAPPFSFSERAMDI